VVGIAVEHAALDDEPTPAPPDAADAVGACVEVLVPSPDNCTARWGLTNAGALIAPAVAVPEVVEVGTLRGSVAEAALADEAGKPGCVAADWFCVAPAVVAGGNGAMVVGATPACCVGWPTCACEVARELVCASAVPKPASHSAIAKMNKRCIASSHQQKRGVTCTVCRLNAFASGTFPPSASSSHDRRHAYSACRPLPPFSATPCGSTA
jgi:hypothetical protein